MFCLSSFAVLDFRLHLVLIFQVSFCSHFRGYGSALASRDDGKFAPYRNNRSGCFRFVATTHRDNASAQQSANSILFLRCSMRNDKMYLEKGLSILSEFCVICARFLLIFLRQHPCISISAS